MVATDASGQQNAAFFEAQFKLPANQSMQLVAEERYAPTAIGIVQDGLTSGAIEWIPIKLHGGDEHINVNGHLEWTGASEGIIRHQYREWARLMTEGP